MKDNFEILVEDNFPDRINRQLIIKTGNVKIESDIISSESKECKKLAVTLISAGYQLLNNHELWK